MKRARSNDQYYRGGPRYRRRPRRNSYTRPRTGRRPVLTHNRDERKYFDVGKAEAGIQTITDHAGSGWANTNVSASTTLFCPQQGAAINQRIGTKVTLKKIAIRGVIYSNTFVNSAMSTGLEGVVVRMALVQDKQTTNASIMDGDDVLGSGAAGQSIDSFQEVNNFGRFQVWKDKTFVLNPGPIVIGSTGGANLTQCGIARPFKITVNFKKGIPIKFNGVNGGTFADIVDNSFHFLVAANDNTGQTCNMSWKSRAYYIDP